MTQPPHDAGWTPPNWEPGQSGHAGQSGQPQYGQPQYGQPQYGQPQYGQPQYGQPQTQQFAPAQYGQPDPQHQGQPTPPATPNRPRTIAIAGAVVAVLAAAGGIYLFTRDSDDGPTGASSPEAGAEQLIKASADQDVDGVLNLVDPAEARSLRALVSSLRDKLSPSGLIAASGVPLPYLSATATDVRSTTDKASDSIAFVTISGGTVKSKIDYDKLPTGLRGDKSGDDSNEGNLGNQLSDVRAGFVKSGSGWFFSPSTTAMEASRVQDDLPSPSFSDPLPDGGGSSPEDAVRGLIKATSAKNAREAARYISSAELPALKYYFSVFARNLNPSQGPDTEVTGMDLATSDLSNGLKKVSVKAITFRTPDGTVTYRDGCYETSGERRCLENTSRRKASLLALGAKKPFVVVEQNAGKWQLAPLATIVEGLRTGLEGANFNQLIRGQRLYVLAPSTGTLRVGQQGTVKLNDAGFARVTLTGRPGQCVSDDSTDAGSIRVLGDVDYYSGNCEGYTMPRSGKVDIAVINSERPSESVDVTIEEG